MGDALIDRTIVPVGFDAFVDTKEILSFCGVVDGDGWPLGDSLRIVKVARGVDLPQLACDRTAADHLHQTRTEHVVFKLQS